MLKIAICDLLFNWPPDGGARVDVKEIAQRLLKYHDVRLFVPDYPSCSFPRGVTETSFNIPVTRISFNHLSFSAPVLGKRFAQALDDFNPDKVWITDGWFLKPYLVMGLKKFSPTLRFYAYETLCLRSHGHCFCYGKFCERNYLADKTYLFCMKCSVYWLRRVRPFEFIQEFVGAGAFLPCYKNLVKKSIKTASSIIVYNEFIKKKLLPFNKNIKIIPSGINCKSFFPKKRGVSDVVNILMVGRTEDYLKGYSVLLDACRLLKKKRVNLKLLVTGSNVVVEEFVHTLGWVRPEKLVSIYHSADICVVPSVWPEPFGIVALEAMASGLPLIATKIGGLGEILDHGVEGFLVPPGDSESLADRLYQLISSPKLREKMGEAGRYKSQFYDWDLIFSKYYSDILAL